MKPFFSHLSLLACPIYYEQEHWIGKEKPRNNVFMLWTCFPKSYSNSPWFKNSVNTFEMPELSKQIAQKMVQYPNENHNIFHRGEQGQQGQKIIS